MLLCVQSVLELGRLSQAPEAGTGRRTLRACIQSPSRPSRSPRRTEHQGYAPSSTRLPWRGQIGYPGSKATLHLRPILSSSDAVVRKHNSQTKRHLRAEFGFNLGDHLHESLTVAPLVGDGIDARVLDRQASCDRINRRSVAFDLIRPTLHRDAWMIGRGSVSHEGIHNLAVSEMSGHRVALDGRSVGRGALDERRRVSLVGTRLICVAGGRAEHGAHRGSRKSGAAIPARVFRHRVQVVTNQLGQFEPRSGRRRELAARRARVERVRARPISRRA